MAHHSEAETVAYLTAVYAQAGGFVKGWRILMPDQRPARSFLSQARITSAGQFMASALERSLREQKVGNAGPRNK
jgi:hypothetical protein